MPTSCPPDVRVLGPPTPAGLAPHGVAPPFAIVPVLVDLDGDGDLDVLAGGGESVWWVENVSECLSTPRGDATGDTGLALPDDTEPPATSGPPMGSSSTAGPSSTVGPQPRPLADDEGGCGCAAGGGVQVPLLVLLCMGGRRRRLPRVSSPG